MADIKRPILNTAVKTIMSIFKTATPLLNGTLSPTKFHQRKVPQAALVVINRWGKVDEYIDFQLPPQEITEGKSANFDSQQILGKSESLRAFVGSEPRQLNFTMDYYWYDFRSSGAGSWYFINENLNRLKALTYPMYGGGGGFGFAPPPKVLFYFGRLYNALPCIVKNVSFVFKAPWVNPDTGDVSNGDVVPFHTSAQIQLETAYNVNETKGYEQIKAGDGLIPRGFVDNFDTILDIWGAAKRFMRF